MKPLQLSFSDLGRQMVQTLVQHLQSPLFLTYILFLWSFWSMLLCQYLKDMYYNDVRNQTMSKKNYWTTALPLLLLDNFASANRTLLSLLLLFKTPTGWKGKIPMRTRIRGLLPKDQSSKSVVASFSGKDLSEMLAESLNPRI